MPVVEMTDQEWQQVLALLSEGPWRVANPLLMKIGGQLRREGGPADFRANSGDPMREKLS